MLGPEPGPHPGPQLVPELGPQLGPQVGPVPLSGAQAAEGGVGGEGVDAVPEVVLRNENDLYRVGAGGAYDPAGLGAAEVANPISGSGGGALSGGGRAERSLEAVVMEAVRGEHERRHRGKRSREEPPGFVEVRQADLMEGARVDPGSAAASALGKEYVQNLRNNIGDKDSGMARRRHQIGTLYHNAKVAEVDTLEGRGIKTKSKRQTAAKYGW